MLLLIPGPVQTRPDVRAAMAVDIAPWDNDFKAEYAAIRETVRALAGGIAGQHACLPLQGAGHFITEAAIRTFVPAGGKLLVVMNGSYAERMARLAREAGREVVVLAVPDFRSVAPEEVAAALAADASIGHVGVVYSETGSGIVNDVVALGHAVRAAGRRMIVDAVSAFGALPFNIAEQPEVDAVVFTSNKCIEGLPGIGFAVCPIERVLACAGNAGSWSFDLSDVYATAMKAGWGSFRFTPPVQALHAFGKALEIFRAEGGQPARLARYRENARLLHEGVQALGMKPYLDWAHQGPIIVTVHQPADPAFALGDFVERLKKHGVLISNFHNTPVPSLRIGCIGDIHADDIRFALRAIAAVLDEMGVARRNAA